MDHLKDVLCEEFEIQAILHRAEGYFLETVDKPVIAEVSMKIYVNEVELASLLCLSQQQVELAIGFLYNEGVIDSFAQVKQASYNSTAVGVFVDLEDSVVVSRQHSLRSITAGCGKCFTYINPLRQGQFQKVESTTRFSLGKIMERMAKFTQESGLYRGVGGVHSLLLHTPGFSVFSEDIGRHNCLDKVTGMLLKAGRVDLAKDAIIFISGRVTSEIMMKTIRLGVPVIVSKSTPSVAAIKLADQYGVTLIGYAKNDSGFVYTGAERLLVVPPVRASSQVSVGRYA